MGRGRAKAKQVKVARQLKYNGGGTDLDRLREELGVGRNRGARTTTTLRRVRRRRRRQTPLTMMLATEDDEDDWSSSRECTTRAAAAGHLVPAAACAVARRQALGTVAALLGTHSWFKHALAAFALRTGTG